MPITLTRRTPLAWRNLTQSPRRLAAILAGIAFAVVLMFMQLGFYNALLDSTVELPSRFDADLILTAKTRVPMAGPQTFPRRLLESARAVDGVGSVATLRWEAERARWRAVDPRTGKATLRRIRLVAFEPGRIPLLRTPQVAEAGSLFGLPDVVLFDVRSKETFGRPKPGDRGELNREPVDVIGTFALGTDFISDGTILTNEQTYRTLFPTTASGQPTADEADFGLIRAAEDADPRVIQAALRARLPDAIAVRTKAEAIEDERDYWRRLTPVGLVFTVGLIMGFVVGLVICYQILYSEIERNTKEFATLKAIGYRNGFLIGVVARMALLLACMGFIPGLGVSLLLYRLLAGTTGLLMRLDWVTAAAVFGLTVAMCQLSGALAVRKLFASNPAELF